MKISFIILIGLFFANHTVASCTWSGLTVFPDKQIIRQNPIFILEGYAESQDIVLKLNKVYPVYLKCGDKKIRLIVKEMHVGQFMLTQALLIPATQLEAGLEYVVSIDSLPKFESLTRYNCTTKNNESIKYKVLEGKDLDKPIIFSSPKEVDKKLIYYGCGPAMYVVFNLPVKDSSEVIIRATVRNIKSGVVTTYFVESTNNKIYIGHGMCSGAFEFDNNLKYEVEFSFMDASGNIASSADNKIKFTKPTIPGD